MQYVYHRQTLQDLAIKYNKSIQWDHYKIKEYPVQTCHFHQNRIIPDYAIGKFQSKQTYYKI